MGCNNREILILTYHSIDSSKSAISVSPELYARHMEFLNENDYRSLRLRDVMRYIRNGWHVPEKGVVITFDDGYENNYTHAYPILQKYNFTATIFLTTKYCGTTNCWPNQHPSIPSLKMLSWEKIGEMKRDGIDFGAHTQSHPRLADLPVKVAEREILESRSDIESHLNYPVELFSYPYGSFNEQVKEITMSAFEGAIANEVGKVDAYSDIYALPRINATSGIFRLLPLRVLSLGNFDMYLLLKTAVNRYVSY